MLFYNLLVRMGFVLNAQPPAPQPFGYGAGGNSGLFTFGWPSASDHRSS